MSISLQAYMAILEPSMCQNQCPLSQERYIDLAHQHRLVRIMSCYHLFKREAIEQHVQIFHDCPLCHRRVENLSQGIIFVEDSLPYNDPAPVAPSPTEERRFSQGEIRQASTNKFRRLHRGVCWQDE